MHVIVPPELMVRAPYNNSAYDFLQFLRAAIQEYGTLEFPHLPVNPRNHTLAQRAPEQHLYSSNTYLTGHCQHPASGHTTLPYCFLAERTAQIFCHMDHVDPRPCCIHGSSARATGCRD
jgi:hypothetical protein